MTNDERERLADLIFYRVKGVGVSVYDAHHIADAILAAGYRHADAVWDEAIETVVPEDVEVLVKAARAMARLEHDDLSLGNDLASTLEALAREIAALKARLGGLAKERTMGDDKPATIAILGGTQEWRAVRACAGMTLPADVKEGAVKDLVEAAKIATGVHNEAIETVAEQACDNGLWFVAETAAEAYLQGALRRLHEAVEGRTMKDSVE